MTRRAWPGTHPGLGALLGFIVLVIVIPYTLAYGIVGLGLALLVAGLVAGALARGGAALGFRAGARAAGLYMLLLLGSWALLILQDMGMVDFASVPELAEFMPYLTLLGSQWDSISQTLIPFLQNFTSMAGGDRFVGLILRVAIIIIPAGIGGAVSGAATGRPEPRPLPMDFNPHYMPGYAPDYYLDPPHPGGPNPGGPNPGGPNLGPPELAYSCPWCGLRILPHMMKCWNCGGPLEMPPPPVY